MTSTSSPSSAPRPKHSEVGVDFDYDPAAGELAPGDVDATRPSVSHVFLSSASAVGVG
jgi:hypothetical protein